MWMLKSCQQILFAIAIVLYLHMPTGVKLKRLCRPSLFCCNSSEFNTHTRPQTSEGTLSVCPHTTVVLTCSDTGVVYLQWFVEPGIDSIGQAFLDSYEVNRTIHDGNFILTLVHVDEGNLTATLEVMSDNLPPEAGTTVTCTSNNNRKELVVNITAPPTFLSELMVVSDQFQTESFDITLSWDVRDADSFTLSTNHTTAQVAMTNVDPLAAHHLVHLSVAVLVSPPVPG